MTTRSDIDALRAAGYQVSPDVEKLNRKGNPANIEVKQMVDMAADQRAIDRNKANPASAVINNPAKLRKLREAVGIKESEDSFSSWLLDCAHTYGWLANHTRPGITVKNGEKVYRTALQGDKGCQDWTLARDGVVLLIELKSESGKLSPEQIQWQKAANGFVFRPSDRDKVKELLR